MTKQVLTQTLKAATEICRNLGMRLTKRDEEYRVTATDWSTAEQAEEYAYYTVDLEDAVATARQMYEDHAEFRAVE